MAIVRAKHQKGFTVITNSVLRDTRLSLREIGLLAVMLSLPDAWSFSIAGLASICMDGTAAVRRAVQTLETCGYVVRTVAKDPATNLRRVSYTVREEPVSRLSENRTVESRTSDSRPAEIRTLSNTEQPNTERPNTEQPNTQKANTEQPNTERSNAVRGANREENGQGAKGTGKEKAVYGSDRRVNGAHAGAESGLAAKQDQKTYGFVIETRGEPKSHSTASGINRTASAANRASPYPNSAASKPRKINAFSPAEEQKWRAQIDRYDPPEGF